MVAIIDYGLGNLTSVLKAFAAAGVEAIITNQLPKIKKAERIVLPGQGAFADGIRNLRSQGLTAVLTQEVLMKKKPFLGICLGMQLLAETSVENGKHQGLGWVKGDVVKLKIPASLRLPHVGWNDISTVKSSALLTNLPTKPDFYFVHSYHLKPKDSRVTIATCTYGETFTAALQSRNIFATLFHPEKSQRFGLQIIKNFVAL